MDQELERAALVAHLRRGDRPWPELTCQLKAAGSARNVLENALDASGRGVLFDTASAVDLDAVDVAVEIAAWEREGLRLVTLLDQDHPLRLRLTVVLRRCLARHEACVAAHYAASGFDTVATVPSPSARANHPLHDIAAGMIGITSSCYRDLLSPAPDAAALGRAASSERYTSSALRGESFLLFDDTCTTGNNAQSPPAVLKSAGAKSVSDVVLDATSTPRTATRPSSSSRRECGASPESLRTAALEPQLSARPRSPLMTRSFSRGGSDSGRSRPELKVEGVLKAGEGADVRQDVTIENAGDGGVSDTGGLGEAPQGQTPGSHYPVQIAGEQQAAVCAQRSVRSEDHLGPGAVRHIEQWVLVVVTARHAPIVPRDSGDFGGPAGHPGLPSPLSAAGLDGAPRAAHGVPFRFPVALRSAATDSRCSGADFRSGVQELHQLPCHTGQLEQHHCGDMPTPVKLNRIKLYEQIRQPRTGAHLPLTDT